MREQRIQEIAAAVVSCREATDLIFLVHESSMKVVSVLFASPKRLECQHFHAPHLNQVGHPAAEDLSDVLVETISSHLERPN